jgi:hypothetical protein
MLRLRDTPLDGIAPHVAPPARIACDTRYARAMKWMAIVVFVVVACGSKKEEPPPEPKEESGGLAGKFGGLADRAKDIGARATEVGKDVAGTAKALGTDAIETAKALAAKAGQVSSDALDKGNQLKSDVKGKLAFKDFDFAVEEVKESEADHQARLAGMKQIKAGDYMVGLAQDAKNPLGAVYKWQFRLAWRIPATERVIVLSVFSNEELADLENAATLLVLVSAAERIVKLP